MLMATSSVMAAGKIDLKSVTDGTFAAKRISGIDPLKGTDQYAQISQDGKQIVQYSFRTGKQTAVLFDVSNTVGEKIDAFDGYILSPDGKRMLIRTQTEPVYRRSYKAVFYIYNMQSHLLQRRRPAAGTRMVARRQPGGIRTRQQHLPRQAALR